MEAGLHGVAGVHVQGHVHQKTGLHLNSSDTGHVQTPHHLLYHVAMTAQAQTQTFDTAQDCLFVQVKHVSGDYPKWVLFQLMKDVLLLTVKKNALWLTEEICLHS